MGRLMRVSAALIVRDEEHHLPLCLESIVDEVDEIIVVDTGSQDRTRDVARQFPVSLLSIPWPGDFSAARNYALDHAQGDWILYIDADERLVVPSSGSLRTEIQRPDAVALNVAFRPRVNFTPYQELRLFRNDKRIRFAGVIHESLRAGLAQVIKSDGLRIAAADIGIDHLGYEGDLTSKHERNLPLLKQAVKEHPNRVFLWVDLAEALAGTGNDEGAKAACWRAVELAEADSDQKQKADAVQAFRRLIAMCNDDAGEALGLTGRAALLYPANFSILLDRARALFKAGQTNEALEIAQRLKSIDPERIIDPHTAYDKRIFGEWAYDLIGACHVRLGNRAAAAEAFIRASELAPDNGAYRIKVATFAP